MKRIITCIIFLLPCVLFAQTVQQQINALKLQVSQLSSTVATQGQQITSLQSQNATMATTIATQSSQLADQANKISSLQTKVLADESLLGIVVQRTKYMFVQGKETVFCGTNLHIWKDNSQLEGVNGLGNLIVGYNHARTDGSVNYHDGSHNIIFGDEANYRSQHCLLGGYQNGASGNYAAAISGKANAARGDYSVVASGYKNSVLGRYGVALSGSTNTIYALSTYGLVGTGTLGGIGGVKPSAYNVVLSGFKNLSYYADGAVLTGSP